MWKQHYEALFNSVPSSDDCRNLYRNAEFTDDMFIYCLEIDEAIGKLSRNKGCGLDGIAEHIAYSSERLKQLLRMCFNSFLMHGFLPKGLMSSVLVPIIKDKRLKISSKNNYRPIALVSNISKVLEYILMHRLETYLTTCDNQFGFIKKHGTYMCIYALK